MRVHQAGGHLMRQRGAEVADWSWRATRRRMGVLFQLTRPYRLRTGFSVFSLLTATISALAPPYLAKYALDDALHGQDSGRLYLVVGIFVAAGLATWGMTYVETYMTGWVGERILADLRAQLFGHLQRLSLGFYERTRAGVIISRLTNDVEAIDQLVTDGVTTLVQSTLTLAGTAVLLFVLDWRLALATLAVIPVMSVGTVVFRKRSTRAYAAVRERLGLVTATLAEDIAGMRMVQAFTRETAATANFRDVALRYRDSNMQTVMLNGIYFPYVDLLSSVALAVVLGYGGHLYFGGRISLGTLFAFMLYVSNFFDPVQQLSQLYSTFLSAVAALDKIMDVLVQEPQVSDAPGAEPLPRLRGHVRFEDVHFTYGTGAE
ncbi:MAG: ABC transporter ATP-binding protein, partial [Gaiellaceae bacterium]